MHLSIGNVRYLSKSKVLMS